MEETDFEHHWLNHQGWLRSPLFFPIQYPELKNPSWPFLRWRWTTFITLRQPTLTDWRIRRAREQEEEIGGGVDQRREVANLFQVGLSYMSVVHLNPSLQNQEKWKIITSLFQREQKNHFVSLTFAACFYFLIVFFSLTVLQKEREDSLSCFVKIKPVGMHR